MKPITPTVEMLKDAGMFASFCQRIKLKFWEQANSEPYTYMQCSERTLDEVLLLAWSDVAQALASERMAGREEARIAAKKALNDCKFAERGECSGLCAVDAIEALSSTKPE